jgi:hypothetical protein
MQQQLATKAVAAMRVQAERSVMFMTTKQCCDGLDAAARKESSSMSFGSAELGETSKVSPANLC